MRLRFLVLVLGALGSGFLIARVRRGGAGTRVTLTVVREGVRRPVEVRLMAVR